MAICTDSEDLLSYPQASRECPGRPHVSTIFRWARRGVRGIRLETVLCGGRRFTSRQALKRFHERVTAAADGRKAEARSTAAHRRQAEIDRAESKLADMGL